MKKNKLKKLITEIFVKHKLNKKHAIICTDAIVNAELVGEPPVAVWAAVSPLSQVTVSPASIVTGFGMKQFGSHPGVDEPSAFVTVTSANALGAIAIRETTDIRTKSELSVLNFMWSRKAIGLYMVFDISTIC